MKNSKVTSSSIWHKNKNKKIKNKKNTKKFPKTTVIETKDEIKCKTKQQPQQQTAAAIYNENKKNI